MDGLLLVAVRVRKASGGWAKDPYNLQIILLPLPRSSAMEAPKLVLFTPEQLRQPQGWFPLGLDPEEGFEDWQHYRLQPHHRAEPERRCATGAGKFRRRGGARRQ